MRILVIRLSALGDVAMAFPAVCEAAERHSDIEYYLLTSDCWTKVPHPDNVHILPYDRKQHRGMMGLLRLFRMAHAVKPNRVIDLHNVMRTWLLDLLFLLTGHRVSMMPKHRLMRYFVLDHVVQTLPVTHSYARMLGVPIRSVIPPTWEVEKENAIGIAPFAGYPTKIYPEELMGQIISQCAAKPGLKVYLFGSRQEAERLRIWAEGHDNITVVPDMHLELHQELHLMRHLRVMVAMDSSNGHLATLAAIPVITIWGGTTPACGFAPWHSSSHNTIVADIPCQPCSIAGSKTCPRGKMICMYSIAPQHIMERIEEYLA